MDCSKDVSQQFCEGVLWALAVLESEVGWEARGSSHMSTVNGL